MIDLILDVGQKIVKMDPDDVSTLWRDPKAGFCVPAQNDESGELLMRIINPSNIESSFQGHYGNKKATNSKMVRDVFKKGDAWFRSGDLLKIDVDSLFYFVDRIGDIFRWKSENVSATEVENEIMASGVVKQSVVVGVRLPQHEGRAGFAVLEPKERLSDQEILDKVYSHTKDHLPKYAIPLFDKIGLHYI